MGRKRKRADFRPPQRQGPAAPARPVARPPEVVVRQGRRAWWPLASALALTAGLVLLMLVLNLDSPPIPTSP